MRELSKYQAKKRKQFLEKHPDSGEIALKLVENENDWEKHGEMISAVLNNEDKRLYIRTETLNEGFGDIETDVYAQISEDCMMWYIWKPVPWKSNRCWFKAVPMSGLDQETIANILDAQPWDYI